MKSLHILAAAAALGLADPLNAGTNREREIRQALQTRRAPKFSERLREQITAKQKFEQARKFF